MMQAESESKHVLMTCMTTKQKFEAQEPTVVVLRNGRYAYKVECPWKGKNDKTLTAFKFCGAKDYTHFMKKQMKDKENIDPNDSKDEESEQEDEVLGSEPEMEPEIG